MAAGVSGDTISAARHFKMIWSDARANLLRGDGDRRLRPQRRRPGALIDAIGRFPHDRRFGFIPPPASLRCRHIRQADHRHGFDRVIIYEDAYAALTAKSSPLMPGIETAAGHRDFRGGEFRDQGVSMLRTEPSGRSGGAPARLYPAVYRGYPVARLQPPCGCESTVINHLAGTASRWRDAAERPGDPGSDPFRTVAEQRLLLWKSDDLDFSRRPHIKMH
jgi:hypothetical protein